MPGIMRNCVRYSVSGVRLWKGSILINVSSRSSEKHSLSSSEGEEQAGQERLRGTQRAGFSCLQGSLKCTQPVGPTDPRRVTGTSTTLRREPGIAEGGNWIKQVCQ